MTATPVSPPRKYKAKQRMPRSQQGDDQLEHKYQHLLNSYNSYIQSNNRRSSNPISEPTSSPYILSLMDDSPRKLVSLLQQDLSLSERWKVRTNELAVEEITRERREAVECGKLKGKKLFDDSGWASEEALHGKEELPSASSCILTHGAEARSCSSSDWFCDSDESEEGICEGDGSSSLPMKNKERTSVMNDEEGEERGVEIGISDGTKWMDKMVWLAFVLIVFALGIISWRSFDGEEPEILIPT